MLVGQVRLQNGGGQSSLPSFARSIFHSFWWFFTTATTVGYGATTVEGQNLVYTGPETLQELVYILLMAEILHQLIGSFSHYLQCFIHPRWCRISAINSSNQRSCLIRT